MIIRSKINELAENLSYFPVVGIIGPRQVGKTTIAKVIGASSNKSVVYVDLENPQDDAKLYDPVLFFQANEEKLIILDEVQRRPDLFPILRSMVDINRTAGRFIVLGSASPSMIRDSSESLAGRISYLELGPFNISEIGFDADSMNKLWSRGGFPNSFLAPSDTLSLNWRINFIRSYVERDLPLLGLGAPSKLIFKLWQMISHSHGNIANYSVFARSLGLSSNSVKKYIEFMEGAFLLRQLQPYFSNIKKRLVKSPKIYVRDSGILHCLQGIDSLGNLQTHPMLGASWEGFVIDQIVQLVPPSIDIAYYRTQQGAECDLVLLKGGKPHMSIEIKYSSAPIPTKGMLEAFDNLSSPQNFIITPASDNYLIRNDIRVCSLLHFTENVLPTL